MSNIDTKNIQTIIQNYYRNELNSDEYIRHNTYLPGNSMLYRPSENQLLINYLLGNKESNKIKHINPNRKIVDATDIDWTGYKITFDGIEYSPTSTFEMLDLIFRLLTILFDKHKKDVLDVEWNDAGEHRSDENKLNWGNGQGEWPDGEQILDENSSLKYWEINENTKSDNTES